MLGESECKNCKYELLKVSEEPCASCRWSVSLVSEEYYKKNSCFEPKEEKEHSSNCTISSKECDKAVTNGNYGLKEISNDEIDMVNHPQHYNREGAIECIDEMITVFGKEIVACFCLCNTWKYRYRASEKGHKEDLDKSDYYMSKYKELITERSILGFESTITVDELKDTVKELMDKWYLEREIKRHDK